MTDDVMQNIELTKPDNVISLSLCFQSPLGFWSPRGVYGGPCVEYRRFLGSQQASSALLNSKQQYGWALASFPGAHVTWERD